jgi:hypothetical protein
MNTGYLIRLLALFMVLFQVRIVGAQLPVLPFPVGKKAVLCARGKVLPYKFTHTYIFTVTTDWSFVF